MRMPRWNTGGTTGMAVAVALMGAALLSAAGLRGASQSGLSRQAAASAASKFRRIQDASHAGRSFGSIRISEEELNSYIQYDLAQEFPPGLSNVRVKLLSGRIRGTADVDFDKLKGSFKTPPNPLIGYFLQGAHKLGVEGTLSGSGGIGVFHLETVSLDNLALPQAVVDFLVDYYLKAHYPNVPLDRPFELGYNIDKLVVESGSVLLTGRATPARNGKKFQDTR